VYKVTNYFEIKTYLNRIYLYAIDFSVQTQLYQALLRCFIDGFARKWIDCFKNEEKNNDDVPLSAMIWKEEFALALKTNNFFFIKYTFLGAKDMLWEQENASFQDGWW